MAAAFAPPGEVTTTQSAKDLLGGSCALLTLDYQDRGVRPRGKLVEVKEGPGHGRHPRLPSSSGGAADVTIREARFAFGIVEAGDGERFVAVCVAIPP